MRRRWRRDQWEAAVLRGWRSRKRGGPGGAMGMCVYLSFPVAVFWVSNQAELFQRYVIDRKREIFPPDTPERRQAMAELKQRLQERKGTQA
ncbi:protein PET100 homolog, mitochondrial isoform X2 [Vidua chalybeata]|uniref:protein PET100 homolog, mitochondrial isoform X2 n=1 Tax=Vidua chalybeata TaxID=81927 RepID=UPI0023A82BE2|nr:protein PET100 homolog, mitochondrial isoform X2 [Vidua chalybeata]